jgi:hypothetical protein
LIILRIASSEQSDEVITYCDEEFYIQKIKIFLDEGFFMMELAKWELNFVVSHKFKLLKMKKL